MIPDGIYAVHYLVVLATGYSDIYRHLMVRR